jgi:hypothetical protein
MIVVSELFRIFFYEPGALFWCTFYEPCPLFTEPDSSTCSLIFLYCKLAHNI